MSNNIPKLSSGFVEKYGISTIRFNSIVGDEMALSEHIEEFSQREV